MLDLYVVYYNPRDYPGQYVIRKQTAGPGTVKIAANVLTHGPSLDQVRAALPPNLSRLERQQGDDPVIVEVWI